MISEKDTYIIEEFAKEKRRIHELGMGPLGDNIFKLVRTLGIQLVRTPCDVNGNSNDPFSALYVCTKEMDYTISFIGLNSADYYDKQIFALAHELYHHYEADDVFVLCRGIDTASELRELKANRFAAEFLLPTERLIQELKQNNYGSISLTGWSTKRLLRLIAELHCDYRLPYKAIVRRLDEIKAINSEQFEKLMTLDARDPNGSYGVIAFNTNSDVFEQLNTRTRIKGTEGENLGKLMANLENGVVSLQELAQDLSLFGKSLDDFQLMEEVDNNDLEELTLFLRGNDVES